jgi:hypothetical protein
MKILLSLILCLLCGCTGVSTVRDAWSFYNTNYDREMSVSTSPDGKPMVSYTIKPKQQAVLSDAQVNELMAHFAEYSAKDGKSVVKPEAAK